MLLVAEVRSLIAFSLSNSVIVLFVAVVVSMEINRKHYFHRDPMYVKKPR